MGHPLGLYLGSGCIPGRRDCPPEGERREGPAFALMSGLEDVLFTATRGKVEVKTVCGADL
ncbi:MAG: hypothetical protein AAFR40_14245, partial [Pseudomonadota bacterium]